MAHNHPHTVKYGTRFAIGIALNVLFVVVEIVYGFIADSTALLADAGHNASDVLSLIFAWGAAWLAGKQPKGKYTYGYRRTTILVSILNALILFVAVGVIGYDAVQKLMEPVLVKGNIVSIVAGIGIIINTATALLFIKGQQEDLNIRGAFLHMAADAGVSAGVVVAGLLISLTGYTWIDPVMSFVIIAVIIYGTWQLLVDSVNLALDAVPKGIDQEEVRNYLLSFEGVEDVHDLHIWALSTTQTALTAHLVMPGDCNDRFIFNVREKLHQQYDIHHTTLQIENTFDDTEYQNGV